MSDLLTTGTTWLDGMRRAHMSRSATYRRGASSVAVLATAGKTVFRVDTGYGMFEHIEGRDYILRASDLVLDDAAVTPAAGDQIVESGRVYEVMAPANEPPWRWSDRDHAVYRIHTKYVGQE